MFRHPAWAVGSYSGGPPAAGTVGTKSTGGFYRADGSPCTQDPPAGKGTKRGTFYVERRAESAIDLGSTLNATPPRQHASKVRREGQGHCVHRIQKVKSKA